MNKDSCDTETEPEIELAPVRAHPLTATEAPSLFTAQQWIALLLLRHRYRLGQDLWSAAEVERLRFLRWLVTTGRIES